MSKKMELSGRGRARARKAARTSGVLGTVSAEDLTILAAAKAAFDVAKAEAAALGAAAEAELIKLLAAAKVSVETSVVCLECGTIYHRRSRKCPECPPEEDEGSNA